MCRVAPVLGPSSSSTSSSAPVSSSSLDPQTKPPAGWKDLLKSSAPYNDNHHYYSTEYPCRYPSNAPGSPAALQTIITTTTKVCPPWDSRVGWGVGPNFTLSVPFIDNRIDHCPQVSYQPCPKPTGALPSYQSCPKPPASLSSYQPCAPPKPPGLPGCSSLMDDVSSSSYSTEVKVMEESGGVIKSLSFQPDPLPAKTERTDSYDYRYTYPNTYRYDDY